jgi:ElaB/YqjD/DUF883 family membrane-anchored ribosome-binding protein
MADTAAPQKAQEAAGQAQEKASELAGQAKEQAQQAAGQAKSQVRTQVDQRSTQAGEQVTSTASDVREVANTLREQGKDKPAQLAEQAADRVERVGSYLTNSDADRILNDVEDFARQRPWAVIAGGVALGFAASRFLKASSTDRYYSSRQTGGGTYGGTYGGGTYGGSELSSGVTPANGGAATGTGIPVAPAGTPASTERFDRPATAGGTVDPTGVDPTRGGPPIPPPSTAGGL